MFKAIKIIILSLLMIFFFTGCLPKKDIIRNEAPATQPSSSYNYWAEQTNINDIDISDIDKSLDEPEPEEEEEIDEEIDDEPESINIDRIKSEQPKIKRIAFPTSEYSSLAQIGKGTIKGTIYLKNISRKVVGANTRLYLNPVTSYSTQWYKKSYLGGFKMEKADSRLFNYLKFTASNSQGEFAFYGVPAGNYYLIGTVKCGSKCGYDNEKVIRIATKVSISGKKVINKNLTRAISY